MSEIEKIIRLKSQSGLSIRQISQALNLRKSTVSDYLRRFKASGLTSERLKELSDQQLVQALFPEKVSAERTSRAEMPDFSWMHTELKKRHVTRQLLWEEYRQSNLAGGGYGYSQYCQLYKDWSKTLSISIPKHRDKAGQKMFVDFSGLKGEVTDSKTGEIEEVEIFVAALGASGYTFAKACRDQSQHSVINAHNHAFRYFGGVPEMIIPDNLKAAVNRADRYDPDLNETYQDMAEHYGTVVLPARPYHPKDKPKVELSVKLVQRWILARLRHRVFFSIEELNEAIHSLLDDLNNRKIKKVEKSRWELYEELDRPALRPLPPSPYVFRKFKRCRVNIDYHIELNKAYYSVPYQLVGKEVEARYTATTVVPKVRDYQRKRIAVHQRLYRLGAYSTQSAHMASAHRIYAEWKPSRLIEWGLSFGKNTGELIQTIMETKPHPEIGFRICMGILNTAKLQPDPESVELAARKMMELQSYRVKHFKAILKNKTYLKSVDMNTLTLPLYHDNLRGAEYYQ
ncbi:MAG: IS21 family transposase [Candidatus Neomarinimicrobiota bacterium]